MGVVTRFWNVTLQSPFAEEEWLLTAFAYYRNGNDWTYYNDSLHGPGFLQVNVKVARLANLLVNLGLAGVSVAMGNSTVETAGNGEATLQFPVGATYDVDTPSIVVLENSTRLVFLKWQDGNNETRRSILLDGDISLVATYKLQYLLSVNSVVPGYEETSWHDRGSNVTLSVADSALQIGPSIGWEVSTNSRNGVEDFHQPIPK